MHLIDSTPKLAKDAEQNGINTIPRSYTFYPGRQSAEPVTESGGPEKSGRT